MRISFYQILISISGSFSIKSEDVHRVSNHPPHILDKNRNISPSSFIPFCQFGKNIIGMRMKQFPVPVCQIFKPKFFNDQLCYEFDYKQFKKLFPSVNNFDISFFVDNNEDRQYSWTSKDIKEEKGIF